MSTQDYNGDSSFPGIFPKKIEFYMPPNNLKNKVGHGGLPESVLKKAQEILDNHDQDFQPLADLYLTQLRSAMDILRTDKTRRTDQDLIEHMLESIVQLKANGGMFHYPLITNISHEVSQFLDVVNEIDEDSLEILQAYHKAVLAILKNNALKGQSGEQGRALYKSMIDACNRYFEKHPLV